MPCQHRPLPKARNISAIISPTEVASSHTWLLTVYDEFPWTTGHRPALPDLESSWVPVLLVFHPPSVVSCMWPHHRSLCSLIFVSSWSCLVSLQLSKNKFTSVPYEWAKKTAHGIHCNNFCLLSSDFHNFGTYTYTLEEIGNWRIYTASPPNTVYVTALPCEILITTLRMFAHCLLPQIRRK